MFLRESIAANSHEGKFLFRLEQYNWRGTERPLMTKKEIAKMISEQCGIAHVLALEAVQMVFDGITETLVSEGRIELRNFGVFAVKRRRARKGRNPRTGESVFVPPKSVVTFKPGREIEQRIGQMKKLPKSKA
jgi:integration host factor subunit beta